MNLLEVRDKAAAALVPIGDDDPNVLLSLVDSIEPPALMLGWGEPWLTPEANCYATGRLVVTAVAGRLMPGEGIAVLEELVDYTIRRLRTDSPDWTLENVSGPRVFPVAKTNYLAARISFRVVIG